MIAVIWGVAGAGKTTIGKLLAQELGWKFYDADDFQPAANIEKIWQNPNRQKILLSFKSKRIPANWSAK